MNTIGNMNDATNKHAEKLTWGGGPERTSKHMVCNNVYMYTVIFGVLVYLWLYNAPSRVSSLGISLVRLLYPAEDRKGTLSLISSSAVPLCPLWSRAPL